MDKVKSVLQIKGIPLIKFQSRDIIEKTQKGKIYAKTLDYYRNLESGSGDQRVGDEFEAMLHVNEGKFISKKTGEISDLRDVLIPSSNSNDYAYCMFSCDHSRMPFSFTDEQKSEILKMGDTALIITDYAEFRHRVEEKAKEEGYNTHFGYVQYYDETKDNVNLLASTLLGVWTLAFWKRKKYSYQQEARFIFSPFKEGTDHIELDIGDISDISKIVDSRSLLSALIREPDREDN